MTKPFGAEELLARIRVALRRIDDRRAANEPIVRGDLVIDRERFRVHARRRRGAADAEGVRAADLPGAASGRVLTHRAILKAIWGPHAVDQPEHLRVLIGSLRKKIEPDPGTPATSSPNRGSGTVSRTSRLRKSG